MEHARLPLPPVTAARHQVKITRKPGSDPQSVPKSIRIRGVAYGLLTDDEPGTVPMSAEAKLALVELSRDPNNEEALRRYRTDRSIRVNRRRFADQYALHGTPILDTHNKAHQVGIITRNHVEGDQLLIDAEIDDPVIIKEILCGNYTGLSIGYMPKVLSDGNVIHMVREVSVCSEPFFHNCLLQEVQAAIKREGAKAEGAMTEGASAEDGASGRPEAGTATEDRDDPAPQGTRAGHKSSAVQLNEPKAPEYIPHFAPITIVPADGSGHSDHQDAQTAPAHIHTLMTELARLDGKSAALDADTAEQITPALSEQPGQTEAGTTLAETDAAAATTKTDGAAPPTTTKVHYL